MLKKLFIIQLVLLVVVIALGMTLTVNNTASTKMIHGGLGFLAGISSIAVAYSAYKTSATSAVKMLTLATVGLTLLAGIGGKLAGSDYSTGLLIMRSSAWLALISSGLGYYKLVKKGS